VELDLTGYIGVCVGSSFESVGSKWLSNKRFAAVNITSSAALWRI